MIRSQADLETSLACIPPLRRGVFLMNINFELALGRAVFKPVRTLRNPTRPWWRERPFMLVD